MASCFDLVASGPRFRLEVGCRRFPEWQALPKDRWTRSLDRQRTLEKPDSERHAAVGVVPEAKFAYFDFGHSMSVDVAEVLSLSADDLATSRSDSDVVEDLALSESSTSEALGDTCSEVATKTETVEGVGRQERAPDR